MRKGGTAKRMDNLSIQSIQKGLASKAFSARELALYFLDAIEKKDKEINAFITVCPEIALSKADEIDERVAKNLPLPSLAGVPFSVKDAILVEGVRCTAGSRMLEHYVAPYSATAVSGAQEAGALALGKTNMDEFGMGASNEHSAFGPVRNPHDLARVAGGSSGGAAASVAAKECIFALGEDTGGSIRLPSAFCGVAGLKPTYGAVSRHGIIALASSLDQVSPAAKTVEDVEQVFRAISGIDPMDATSAPYAYVPQERPIKGLAIGIPKEYFGEGLDPDVENVVRRALSLLEGAGARIVEVSLPHAEYALSVYYIINTAEASSNLARYDGVRYGGASRGALLGSEVKRRIMLGTYALSAGYYEAYYGKAQKVRTLISRDFEKAFESVDLIMGPVAPFVPFAIGERVSNPLSMYLVDIYMVPVNIASLPALSVPAGKVGALPVGLHMIAPRFREDLLLSVGKSFEHIRGDF
ncbi:MAG: Asp-tRNA(Asn)/Glu-tRNA(Gln) amidotransferase subunit GatA [Candidatus Wildermuthbacteria bacterium]|nr:Asp-tRNA(Asn)/Glu-tRNA(Gln) amidotransferase subunit GatA [Candidatus Wildermuthbacteria bacterium]